MKKLLLKTLCLLLALSCVLGMLVSCKKPDIPNSDNTPDPPPDTPQDQGGGQDNQGNGGGGGEGSSSELYAPDNYTTGLEYHLLANGYAVTGIGTADDEDVVIPSVYKGRPVVSIESYSFFNTPTRIKSVNIPGSVTSIGEWAFYGNHWIKSVTIGQGVKQIGSAAFWGCSNLESISLPSSLLHIGSNAFFNCDNVTYTELENGLYLGNTQNPYVLLVKAKEKVGTSFAVESQTKFIYSNAFDGWGTLASISIPDSVISIGQNAFYGCGGLSYTAYSNGKYLGNAQNPHHALIGCIDGDATALEIHSATGVIGSNAFYGACMTSLSIPASVVNIDDGAFYGCYDVTSLTLAEGLQTIGAQSFFGCYQIPSVTLPASLSFVACDAFLGFGNHTTLRVESGNGSYIAKDSCLIERNSKTLILTMKNATLPTDGSFTVIGDHAMRSYPISGSFAIPQGVTRIGAYAFFEKSGMSSVSFPETLTAIASYAFTSTGLTELTVPSTVKKLDLSAFSRCDSLTKATVNATVTALPAYLFSECSALEKTTIASAVTSIGEYAFSDCTVLEAFSVPAGVTKIGEGAFKNCSQLNTVCLPAGLTYIDDDAFENCYNLSSITLPVGLATIGNYAFSCCYELKSIVIPVSVQTVLNGAFNYIGGPIYCEAAERPMPGWSEDWTTVQEITWGCAAQ